MGPRQLRKVVGRARTARTFHDDCRQRAEQVLRQMLKLEHSCRVHRLVKRAEPIEALVPVVAYLSFYEWISSSEDGLSIWLGIESRAALRRAVENANALPLNAR